MRKEDFKVYSNPDIKKMMKEKVEEVTFDLQIPDEDTITVLFLSSPYFPSLMREPGYWYYPVELTAEETQESLMAPILSKEVLQDFVESTRLLRLKEKIFLAPLLHLNFDYEDEDEEMEMVSLFEGPIQLEFTKFFKTVVMATNVDEAFEDEFDEAFDKLMEQLDDNGYLGQVLTNIAMFMDDPEVLSDLLFPEYEEDYED